MNWQYLLAIVCILGAAAYLAYRATRKECNACGPKPTEPLQELKLRKRG